MKKSVFSQWFAVVLLFSALVVWSSVSIREAAAMGKGNSAAANDPADIEAVRQVGNDMGNAMVAADIDKLNQIFADDWVTLGSSGKVD